MRRQRGRRAIAAICGLLAAASGCGKEEPESSIPRTAVHLATRPATGGAVSKEGNFFASWPAGCDRLVTRTTESSTGMGRLVAVTCDRRDRENEGAAVRIHIGLPGEGGGPPSPRTVIEMVRKEMANFRVNLMSQQPIRRGPLEGVQVLCQEPDGKGQVWIEGLLLGGDVYLLMAWKGAGGLFDDPEFVRFFASFDPTPEDAGDAGGGRAAAGGGSS